MRCAQPVLERPYDLLCLLLVVHQIAGCTLEFLLFFDDRADLEHHLLLLLDLYINLRPKLVIEPRQFLLSPVGIFHLTLSLHKSELERLEVLLLALVLCKVLTLIILQLGYLLFERLIGISLPEQLLLGIVELAHLAFEAVDQQHIPVGEARDDLLQLLGHFIDRFEVGDSVLLLHVA